VAHDGEAIGFLEDRSAGLGRNIAAGTFLWRPRAKGRSRRKREIVTGLEKRDGRAPVAHYPQPVKRELG